MGMEMQVTANIVRTNCRLPLVGLSPLCDDDVENPWTDFLKVERSCIATRLGRVHRAGRVGHFVDKWKEHNQME